MRNHITRSLLLVACVLLVSATVWAHHGQGLSFDTAHMWTTWATVEEFHYINPHPAVTFSRVDKNGKVEHWSAECGNNPSRMARDGWTKTRSMALLKPGTKVKLYVGTSLAGGFNGIVNRMRTRKAKPSSKPAKCGMRPIWKASRADTSPRLQTKLRRRRPRRSTSIRMRNDEQ